MADAQPSKRNVAILIFDGVEIIDFSGPYEVFGQAGFHVYAVAAEDKPVACVMGLSVNPACRLEERPLPDILVVPGGEVDGAQNHAPTLRWIAAAAKQAEITLSVCNGAFLLAAAGLLDGLQATTYYGLIDELAAFAPKTEVVSNRRFVDNGRIVASAGLSSGIDGSLHVVAKLLGKAAAQQIALNMEYNWQPGSTYARAAFADKYLRRIFGRGLDLPLPSGAAARLLGTEGGVKHWEAKWVARAAMSPGELLAALNQRLMKAGGWTSDGTETPQNNAYSFWSFNGDDGGLWNGIVTLFDKSGGQFVITLKIYRTDLDTGSLA